MKVIFYNNFHNGDIHYSREFVKDIMKKLPENEYYYSHRNHNNLLKDIKNIRHINVPLDNSSQIQFKDNMILINTWIGQCSAKYLTQDCSLYSNYNMYQDIYKLLGIEIENIEFYIPSIDFCFVEKNGIDNFSFKSKKVLICNGTIYSDQCPPFSFDYCINILSDKFSDIDFILTSESTIKKDNVHYTSNIIKINGNDLNEIAYLSTQCNVIVGRASGPHAFTHIKENFNNPDKIFISFTYKKNEGMWYDNNICQQIWSDDFSGQNIIKVIENKIKNL